ncbi:MAG: carboxypeptidase regulatory-like domain-containing protein [Methanobacteriota archaeon]|nr:MAG: carboxypeptidase regulatory-like domain-containing protein [Euryarchaeota archaeon]
MMKPCFIVLLTLSLAVLGGCLGRPMQQTGDVGYLEGRVSIGPLCPVERSPPEPACTPSLETYHAWPIGVWTAGRERQVASIEPDENGAYRVGLPAGTYTVDLVKPGRFGGNLPATVTITGNETTLLDITIDTGIR